MDSVLSLTPQFFGSLKSMDGTSHSGKKSFRMKPAPAESTFQSTAVPRPVPYTCLFRYCSSNDCSSSSRTSKFTVPAYFSNTKSLFTESILSSGWRMQLVPCGVPTVLFTTIIVRDVVPFSIFLLRAVISNSPCSGISDSLT